MVGVRYYSDPACPWSWAAEPFVRKLMVQFGDGLSWTFVMGGLARDLKGSSGSPAPVGSVQLRDRMIRAWLKVADQTGAPLDPVLWVENPIATTYRACMAVKAAADQAQDAGYRYLRRLREGLMCERRKLDHLEALVEEGRAVGLDVERFRVDLRSHGTTEAFADDLEETKALAGAEGSNPISTDGVERCSRGAGGAPLPSIVFRGADGVDRLVSGLGRYEDYRGAAQAAGAQAADGRVPGAEELVARFGRVTTAEVEIVCELPGPRAGSELFRLAEQWRLRPQKVLTGYLWEAP
jgi:predicted DsbA family dithiol-disulfide isomerase